jgi:hypothetical protein
MTKLPQVSGRAGAKSTSNHGCSRITRIKAGQWTPKGGGDGTPVSRLLAKLKVRGMGHPPHQSDFPRLAGGTIPFIRKYSTICP